GLHRLPSFLFQMAGDQLPDTAVVVNDEDRSPGQTLVRAPHRPPLWGALESLPGGPGGNGKGEGAAQPRLADHRDGAPMHLDELPNNAQPQPGPPMPPSAAAI